jgi:hypothetical protein
MTLNKRRQRRRGSILPLVVVSLVAMCGFVALSIDLGLIAAAKTQCQNSADASAMAGARALDGTLGQNVGDTNTPGTSKYIALHTAISNLVLNSAIPAANVTLTYGAWHYDTANHVFTPNFPPVSPDNYNLVQTNVSYQLQTSFASVFQYINPSFNSLITVQAQAQAAHRPRDVAIVLDYSGSMNNESDLWNCESYLDNGSNNTTNGYRWPKAGNPGWTSNNTETVYPLFGGYSGTSSTAGLNAGNDYSDYSANPNLLCPAAVNGNTLHNNQSIGKSNVATDLTSSQGVPAMATDFWKNNRGSTATAAFASAGAGDATTHIVAGDDDLHVNFDSTKPYAQNVADLFGGATNFQAQWEIGTKSNALFGYDYGYAKEGLTGKTLQGYTQGPNYWGKTFFIWPPDPRPSKDWRQLYFLNSTGSAGLTDNTKLFQNGANFNNNRGVGYIDPPGNSKINYKAILNFIKNVGPNPFPSQLRSGNVLIYSSIPADVPAASYDHTQANSSISDPDQRFWKEYIDWTLGVWRDPTGTIQHSFTPSCSIGPDFMYGSKGSISADSTQFGGGSSTVQIHGTGQTDLNGLPLYMNYQDNPWRPRHRMWFGPMTMIQFMMDVGYLPGTTHDISMFPMKQGVGGALTDIQNNHPNDLVAMLLFSRPVYGNDPPGVGKFNVPQYSLTNDYASMLTSLWVPPGSNGFSGDVKVFGDPNFGLVPCAHGDYDANTASSFGFMQAYNQFSGNQSALVNQVGMGGSGTATVGGLGRRGATRLVIFETDGMANEDSQPVGGTGGLTNSGAYNSYYNIRPTDTVNGAAYSQNNLLSVVESICNHDDGSFSYTVPSGSPTPPVVPGYATVNKPAIVHCIAFGAIFETPNSAQSSAVPLLQDISTIGGTTFPGSSTDPANGYKWCIGTLQQRQQKLQKAFLNILDSSVPVSLIQ